MMNVIQLSDKKFKLIVPKGIRYISDWIDYNLNDPMFDFPHILDKKIPGCGYTEYCLRNGQFLILCSPRRILLTNKEAQHPNEVFYFRSIGSEESESYDTDLIRDDNAAVNASKSSVKPTAKEAALAKLMYAKRQQEVEEYVLYCINNNIPAKILVTYDSFRALKKALLGCGLFYKFQIVVDEFQSIFTDSRFKSTTEMDLLRELNDKCVRKLCFVSATPMLEEYLSQLDEFKDLPYFELDWVTEDSTRLIKPLIDIRFLKSISSDTKPIIESYTKGNFKKSWVSDPSHPNGGYNVESKEAVFFVNSVKNILTIIKKNSLTPDQCNILCADTSVNQSSIAKKLGPGFSIGSVPLKGEPHKMFTFCTRTVYLGSDFYSTCARTFIFSDANIDTLAVDISLDLPQILGRQRLSENPWRNEATVYIKPLAKSKAEAKEEFNKRIEDKKTKTQAKILAYNQITDPIGKVSILETIDTFTKLKKYKYDYVSCNYDEFGNLIPVENRLVMLSEIRAYEIQQVDYKDRFTVFNAIQKTGDFQVSSRELDRIRWRSMPNFRDAFKDFCDCPNYTHDEKLVLSTEVSSVFGYYYNNLDELTIRRADFTQAKMDTYITKKNLDILLDFKNDIINSFIVGNRYLRSDIKNTLLIIYRKYDPNMKPKASDLEKWFELKDVLIHGSRGYEILKLK